MPPIQPPTDLPIHAFPTASALESYLEREHATARGFHLKFAKKASGIQSISPPDAVETALCFGWIDGRANPLDENYWLVRYTPRRPKSIWSQKNVATVTRLLEQGRMRPAGIAAVDAAKGDGRWDRAYAGPAGMELPEDFMEVLAGFPAAGRFFESLNRSERYAVLWRVQTAAPAVRMKRIGALVGMLARGETGGKKGGDGDDGAGGMVDNGVGGKRKRA